MTGFRPEALRARILLPTQYIAFNLVEPQVLSCIPM